MIRAKVPVLFLIAVLGALVGIWGACQSRDQLSSMSIARVTRRNFTPPVLATGVVNPQVGAEVRVGARVSGRVERLFTNIGDMVKKGDIIAQLENDDIEATVAQRKAELNMAEATLLATERLYPKEVEKAEAEVTKWQATVKLAKKELARKQDLVKDGLASEQELDTAQETLSVAEAELVTAEKALELIITQYEENIGLARIEVQSTRAALDNAKALLSFTTITAPISGIVGSVSTQEGETVAAGFNAPTFVTIIDLGRLQVDAYVDEVDIGKVEIGQKAVFTVDAFPAREFSGQVRAIYPKAVIQENVVNYVVVIEIDKPYEGVLRPEMTSSVTIFFEKQMDMLGVPVKALKREGGRNVVYVWKDGKPELLEIKVGRQEGQWIEVLEGLEEGQAVLLEVPEKIKSEP